MPKAPSRSVAGSYATNDIRSPSTRGSTTRFVRLQRSSAASVAGSSGSAAKSAVKKRDRRKKSTIHRISGLT